MTTLLFSYGKKVEPQHDKLNAFRGIAQQYGIETINIPYNFDDTADQRAQQLLDIANKYKDNELIFVGLSMGGYASLLVSEKIPAKAMFLMSPALFMEGYQVQNYDLSKTGKLQMIIGWEDTVVPLEKILNLAQSEKINLHTLKDNHALSTSLDTLTFLFNGFLQSIEIEQ